MMRGVRIFDERERMIRIVVPGDNAPLSPNRTNGAHWRTISRAKKTARNRARLAWIAARACAIGDAVRRIDSVRVEAGGEIVDLLFRGEGFLYNQVRIMAAAILEAGRGRLALDDISAALEGGERKAMPGALGAFGLCLVAVYY